MKSWRRYFRCRLLPMLLGVTILSGVTSGQIVMAAELDEGQTSGELQSTVLITGANRD